MKYYLTILSLIISIFFACDQSVNNNNIENNEYKIENSGAKSLVPMNLGQSNYNISLPQDYSINETEGPDFTVYYFSPKDTTKTAEYFGGIYFGNFPNEFSPENEACKTIERKSGILNSNGNWTVINCEGIYSIQTIVDSNSGEDWNKFVHAFGHSNSDPGLQRLFDIFQTFRMTEVR